MLIAMGLMALTLTGCVEDVAKDKVEAVVEDVKEKGGDHDEAAGDDHGEAAGDDHDAEAPAAAAGVEWALLKEKSSINALGAKITATHPITFKDFDAKVMVDGGKLTGLSYTVQMGTLEADHPKLTAHLLNEDFFDVANFPTSTFESSKITEGSDTEGMTHTVEGTLTIHGMSKMVTFPVNVDVKPKGIKASTEFAINRQDFGVVYAGKADDLIQDNVVMTVVLVAQDPTAG
jgi:polyisoprenoid-binding protein YceI